MRTLLWSVAGLFVIGMGLEGLTDPMSTDRFSRNFAWGCIAVGVFGLWRALESFGRNHEKTVQDREAAVQLRIDQAVEKARAEERTSQERA